MKKVAVITRTKNRPILLQRAFEGIKNQTFKDYIWVIVNDGGEVAPVEGIVLDANNSGMETLLIHNELSLGMEAASNRGIKQSDSEYVVIHDDDDSWDTKFLQEAVSYLESNEGKKYGGVVTHSYIIKEVLSEEKCTMTDKDNFNDHLDEIYLADIAKNNSFPPISFLYRRDVYNKAGGYNESLPVLGDWDFNLRFLLESDIAVIPKPLANYHHRVQGVVNSEYGNTVVQGIDKHHQYDTILRNHLLREDVRANKFGLGYLVTMERDNQLIVNNIGNINLTKDIRRIVKEYGVWGIVKKCFLRK
jgi:glycosyltransferase involved in cell wall biosynthesis